jgi:hypothetical protein
MVLLHWGLGWYHHVHSQLDYSIAMITVLYGIAAIHQGLRHLAVLLLLFLLVMALEPPVVFPVAVISSCGIEDVGVVLGALGTLIPVICHRLPRVQSKL